MVDLHGLGVEEMVKILKQILEKTGQEHGIIMFDLHPIRLGQSKYINLLKEILAFGEELNGWFPNVTEAVEYWLIHKEWKDGASFCCLLTGDIDTFYFIEYLTRLF